MRKNQRGQKRKVKAEADGDVSQKMIGCHAWGMNITTNAKKMKTLGATI